MLRKLIYIVLALFATQLLFFIVFLMIPLKIDLSTLEGLTTSQVIKNLGKPDHDLEAKGILAWEYNGKVINQNVVVIAPASAVSQGGMPITIGVSNILGMDTQYFRVSKFSNFDKADRNFVRTTMITIWPYGYFQVNKEIYKDNESGPGKTH